MFCDIFSSGFYIRIGCFLISFLLQFRDDADVVYLKNSSIAQQSQGFFFPISILILPLGF